MLKRILTCDEMHDNTQRTFTDDDLRKIIKSVFKENNKPARAQIWAGIGIIKWLFNGRPKKDVRKYMSHTDIVTTKEVIVLINKAFKAKGKIFNIK